MIFCGKCARSRGWDRPPVRVSNAPCDICGGFDTMVVTRRSTKTPRTVNQRNYSQDDRNLPGTQAHNEIDMGAR